MYGRPVNSAVGIGEFPARPIVIARGGNRSRGEVVKFDLAMTDPDTTNNREGDENSGLTNVVDLTAAARRGHGVLAVCEADIGDNDRGYAKVYGFVKALVQKASGNIALDDPLVAHVDGYLTADLQSGDRIVAFAREAVTAPTTPTIAEVAFDGVHGGPTVV